MQDADYRRRPDRIVTDQHLRQRLTSVRNGWDGTGGPPAPTVDDIAYARILLSDSCSYCGEHAGCIDHIDHLQHGWTNLTASCHGCNVSKGQHSLLRTMLARRLRTERDFIIQQISALGSAHGPREVPLNVARRNGRTSS